MNSGELMVVLIIAIVMIASIVKQRAKYQHGAAGDDQTRFENERLHSQVKHLQDRIHVLERIVTDRGVETAAQIEALRDRDTISEEDKA